MRKIIYAQLVSLDGYIEDAEGNIGWTKPEEELHHHFNELEKTRISISTAGECRKPWTFGLRLRNNPA